MQAHAGIYAQEEVQINVEQIISMCMYMCTMHACTYNYVQQCFTYRLVYYNYVLMYADKSHFLGAIILVALF